MKELKTLYLLHEYGARSHFKALYECAEKYGYSPTEQIILSNYSLCVEIYRGIFQKRDFGYVLRLLKERFKLIFLRNQILIVGIAPYDFLLNRYKGLLRRNRSYYFTSFTHWDSDNGKTGTERNRTDFEILLRECFCGAFCVSKKSENGLKRFVENTSVVNHAISCMDYIKTIPQNSVKRYAFLGLYTPRKNIGLILKWFQKNPDVNINMDFMGEGELSEEINKAAMEDLRIKNIGFVDKKSIMKNLHSYDYLILPSKEEPFGIVLLEALACGVPCIVSNADGPTEIIENGRTGFVFDLNNEEKSFDKVMKQSLEVDRNGYLEMRKNALAEGSHYDASEVVKQWMRLLI